MIIVCFSFDFLIKRNIQCSTYSTSHFLRFNNRKIFYINANNLFRHIAATIDKFWALTEKRIQQIQKNNFKKTKPTNAWIFFSKLVILIIWLCKLCSSQKWSEEGMILQKKVWNWKLNSQAGIRGCILVGFLLINL